MIKKEEGKGKERSGRGVRRKMEKLKKRMRNKATFLLDPIMCVSNLRLPDRERERERGFSAYQMTFLASLEGRPRAWPHAHT